MRENELITIYEPGSEAEFMVISSLLDEQQIKFFTKNRAVQNLFGYGTLNTGFNPVTGPIKIQVNHQDYAEAMQIINEFKTKKTMRVLDIDDIELDKLREYNHAIAISIILGIIFPGSGIFSFYKAYQLGSNPQITNKSRIKLFLAFILNISGLIFWSIIIAIQV